MTEFFISDLMTTAGIVLSTRLSGYQPQYFPRLHYFARMLDTDIFTISDYLQYVRKHAFKHKDGTTYNGVSYQAHTPIKTHQEVQTLGIPVVRERHQKIRDAKVDYTTPWHVKHLNILRDSYARAPYFSSRYPEIAELLSARYSSLSELNMASIAWGLCTLFELPLKSFPENIEALQQVLPHTSFRLKKFILLDERLVPPPDKSKNRDANDWLIEQCRVFGATEYYFGGTSAAAYMDFERFKHSGITLAEQNWVCAKYPQLHGDFMANLSIIDLMMNVSPEEARTILQTK